jgi:hypothetical protein
MPDQDHKRQAGAAMSHSTDVYLACHCDQCHGAEAIVTALGRCAALHAAARAGSAVIR